MNRMSALLQKIARRLGTRPLNLPDHLSIDNWVDIIEGDTLPTFSRYFPHKITVNVDGSRVKDGFYFIEESISENYEILGVKDINWNLFALNSARVTNMIGYGLYDYLACNYGMDDIALLQVRADATSLFNTGLYINFQPPNMVKIESVNGGNFTRDLIGWPIDILVQHPTNLMTIEPTKMEIFENLATADVAVFLFNELRHYRDLETVFANSDIKIDGIEEKANTRNDIIDKLENSYVSAANTNQPIMYTIG